LTSGGFRPLLARTARDPRAVLAVGAILIEMALLWLWPAAFLSDYQDSTSRIGQMFTDRYPLIGAVLHALKAVVDRLFPGALWTWEHLVSFIFEVLLVAFAAYALSAWRTHARGEINPWWIFGPLLAFEFTLVLLPASFTTDIFNYALYGEMPVFYAANPFIHTPGEFPQNPLFYMIPTYWHDAPSVYGPLWIDLSAGIAAAFRSVALADELLAYRLIANLAHGVNATLVWQIARRIRPAAAPAAALAYAWNPLLLLEFSMNGHNDVLMLTLLLGACLTAMERHWKLAALLLGLSIATKYTSALVALPLLVWTARQHASSWRVQLRILTSGGLISLAVVCVLYAPWIQGWDTFGPVWYWMSGPRIQNFLPEPILTTIASWSAIAFHQEYDAAWNATFELFKALAKGALVLLVIWESWRSRTIEQTLRGCARIFLMFLLTVNTWVMPWYFSWPLAIVAPIGWGSRTVRICASITLTACVLLYQRQMHYAFVPEWGGFVLLIPLLLAPLPAVVRGARGLWLRDWLGAGHLIEREASTGT